MGKNTKPTLGRSIIKQRFGGKRDNKTNDGFLQRHTTDVADGYDWGRLNLQSVTDQSNLDDFLATAELAGTEFAAEKMNITFVNPSAMGSAGILSAAEKKRITQVQNENRSLLSIPRRPVWSTTMSAEELQLRERDSFLEWRRQLAELQEIEGIMLTPFEKNLEFWRQLWRVIERSDVVVQIVDARNPLLFRCEDLEKYVSEVDKNKMNMILVNKADFLTAKQREFWADYFESVGLPAVFFSALLESDLKVDEEEVEIGKSDENDTDRAVVEATNEGDSITIVDKSLSTSSSTEKGKLCSREELITVFKNCQKKSGTCKDDEKITTIGLVGYPNVGKSSTINAIMTLKKVSVSATPGKTKHFQTLYVDNELMLCDCPGLVMPTFISTKAEMVVSGILPIDQMKDHVGPVNLVASIIPRHVLESTYGILLPTPGEGDDPTRPPSSEELLNSHGYMRGFMTQRGLPDNPRAARYILKDYVNGKLLYCHAPPNVTQDVFHPFPPPKPKRNGTQTPYQAKVMRVGKIGTQDLDREFFKKVNVGVHIKKASEVQGSVNSGFSQRGDTSDAVSVSSTSQESNEKPWKKHNNRGKKEKLRRIYADLDE